MILLHLVALDGSDTPGRGSMPIQLALEIIGRIRELIGALRIEEHTHNMVFLAWFLRRRGQLTHQKDLRLLLLHIVAFAADHECPRFLYFQVFLPPGFLYTGSIDAQRGKDAPQKSRSPAGRRSRLLEGSNSFVLAKSRDQARRCIATPQEACARASTRLRAAW